METIKGHIQSVATREGEKEGKAWKMYIYEINGKKFSGFNDLEFKEGDKVQLAYEQKGQYLNFKSGVMIEPSTDGPTGNEEIVEDKPQSTGIPGKIDDRQKSITLGQAVNLAQKHMFDKGSIGGDEKEFFEHLTDLAKKYFSAMVKLQGEIL